MVIFLHMGKISMEEFDFDLPDVKDSTPAKPRGNLHVGGSVCLSCEG